MGRTVDFVILTRTMICEDRESKLSALVAECDVTPIIPWK